MGQAQKRITEKKTARAKERERERERPVPMSKMLSGQERIPKRGKRLKRVKKEARAWVPAVDEHEC